MFDHRNIKFLLEKVRLHDIDDFPIAGDGDIWLEVERAKKDKTKTLLISSGMVKNSDTIIFSLDKTVYLQDREHTVIYENGLILKVKTSAILAGHYYAGITGEGDLLHLIWEWSRDKGWSIEWVQKESTSVSQHNMKLYRDIAV